MFQKVLETKMGSIILSIILGLGLAAAFRQVCKGNDCMVIQGPKVTDTSKYFYKIDEDCYQYTPYVTQCKDDK